MTKTPGPLTTPTPTRTPSTPSTPSTAPVPIEKIDSATRAPAPLEQAAAEQHQREIAALAAGNPGLPFLPPGDTTGVAPNPNAPTPPPYDNTYSFSIFTTVDQATNNYMGQTVRVVAPNVQAAYQAVKAQYGATLLNLRGPCPVFVGADHAMSQAAGA